MDKIVYNKITVDDNWMLVIQALIDKQGEIIDKLNGGDIIIYREEKING